MAEAIIMYFLVLGVHSLRDRWGRAPFYALLGGITAIMSWVTDAGLAVEVAGITFVVGSTVFYTSLLLGVFVLYVFDGPRTARVAISTIAGISALMPLVAAVLHAHMGLDGGTAAMAVPQPSLRINSASVATTLVDMVFLGVAWEFLGKPRFNIQLWSRTWLTLLGVMWLDVLLFATAAFAGTPGYAQIIRGTLVTRFFISLFALPFLHLYLRWQTRRRGAALEHRPVLAILSRVAEMEEELSEAEQEIERRKQIEAKLRESKALLDATGRLAKVGGWHMELPSRRVSWTKETQRIHEVKPSHDPTSLHETLSFFGGESRDRLEAALRRAIELGEPYDMELEFVTARGSHRWVRAVCEPRVVDGETVELLGAFQDITERKSMETQLHQQERLAAVGQMAAGIAHDFRNRVNAILLYAEMALNQHELPTRVAQSLETIISESRGIADLVQQILDFSGQSMMALRPLDLAELVRDVAKDAEPDLPATISITVAADSGDYMMEADRKRMRQALENLIFNARDAMPDGGALSLTLRRVPDLPDTVSEPLDRASDPPDGTPREWLCLAVSDAGTGMSEEVRQHLFEPFFTTKEVGAGTGLGLSQVRGIVQQHGGFIDVETAPGEGTTVRVYLPPHCDGPQESEESADEEGARTTILLVEPNDTLRHAEQDWLESEGYHVLTARNANHALSMIQSARWSAAKRRRISAIIAPLEMPRMSGESLIAELMRAQPHLKALAISERPLDEGEIERLREAGFADVVVKPVEAEALGQALREVLGGVEPLSH